MLHGREKIIALIAIGIATLITAVALVAVRGAERRTSSPPLAARAPSTKSPLVAAARAARPPQPTVTRGAPVLDEARLTEETDFAQKVVTVAPGRSAAAVERAVRSVGGRALRRAGDRTVVASLPRDRIAASERALVADPNVARVETDFALGVLSVPDWGVQRVKAPEVWTRTTGSGVRVAIVDTGVDAGHPDLAGQVVGGIDIVNQDSDPQDDHGHGTAIAGIVAAAQNSTGLIGASHRVPLLAVKVLGSDGFGTVSSVVEGIDWAVANGARIINLSLGTTFDSATLREAVERAANRGILVVAAAGNTGSTLLYPAAYDAAIAVGATNRLDQRASFSALGVELVSPGVEVTAPWPGGYVLFSGTSASAPHVSGVAALLLADGITEVRQALRNGVADLGPPGPDPEYGYGLPEATRALQYSQTDGAKPIVSFIAPLDGQTISGQQVVRVQASDNRRVAKVDLLVNGTLLSSSSTPPYRWRWDLRNAAAGTYQLTAQAFDLAGNMGEANITVQVLSSQSRRSGNGGMLGSGRSAPTPATGTSVSSSPSEDGPSSGPPEHVLEKLPPAATGRGR